MLVSMVSDENFKNVIGHHLCKWQQHAKDDKQQNELPWSSLWMALTISWMKTFQKELQKDERKEDKEREIEKRKKIQREMDGYTKKDR